MPNLSGPFALRAILAVRRGCGSLLLNEAPHSKSCYARDGNRVAQSAPGRVDPHSGKHCNLRQVIARPRLSMLVPSSNVGHALSGIAYSQRLQVQCL